MNIFQAEKCSRKAAMAATVPTPLLYNVTCRPIYSAVVPLCWHGLGTSCMQRNYRWLSNNWIIADYLLNNIYYIKCDKSTTTLHYSDLYSHILGISTHWESDQRISLLLTKMGFNTSTMTMIYAWSSKLAEKSHSKVWREFPFYLAVQWGLCVQVTMHKNTFHIH